MCNLGTLTMRIAKALMLRTSFLFISGPRCEYEDSCLSSPCANAGTCSSLSGGRYTCSCPPGYTGPRCFNDTNECAAIPSICQNEGECVNTPGSYKWVFYNVKYVTVFSVKTNWNEMYDMDCQSQRCVCGPGFTGRHCENSYIPCSPSPCLNGGTCHQNSETSYSCHCLPGRRIWILNCLDLSYFFKAEYELEEKLKPMLCFKSWLVTTHQQRHGPIFGLVRKRQEGH